MEKDPREILHQKTRSLPDCKNNLIKIIFFSFYIPEKISKDPKPISWTI